MSQNKDTYNKEYYSRNRESILKQKREYAEKNKERIRLRRRERYFKKREEILLANKKWREENKESVSKSKKEYFRKNKDKHHTWARNSAIKLKIETFNHYSNGNMCCKCCGERELKFLAIDHINGGGGKERRETRSRGGTKTYRMLKQNNYPSGYQVLCHNCNMAKGFWGTCPHINNASHP